MLATHRRPVSFLAVFMTTALTCGVTFPARTAETVAPVAANDVQALIDARVGKVVVVNFWASWCPPCLEEFPDIVELFERYHSEGLDVLAVSMNDADEASDIEDFLEAYEPPFPVYRAASVDAQFYEGIVQPWFGEIPITLVFDTDGELAHYHRRPIDYQGLASDVTALLP